MITEKVPLATVLNNFEGRISQLEKEVADLKKAGCPMFMHNTNTGETVPMSPEAKGHFNAMFRHMDELFKKIFG